LTLQVEPEDCKLTDPYYDYPYGLIEFEAQCESAEVTMFYHGTTILPNEYRKYGPETPGDKTTTKWYRLRNDIDFLNNVKFGTGLRL